MGADTSGYLSKPRPVVVVQVEFSGDLESVVVCGLSSGAVVIPGLRVTVNPSPHNGLDQPSTVMVDKLQAIHYSRLRKRVGRISDAQLEEVRDALRLLLDL